MCWQVWRNLKPEGQPVQMFESVRFTSDDRRACVDQEVPEDRFSSFSLVPFAEMSGFAWQAAGPCWSWIKSILTCVTALDGLLVRKLRTVVCASPAGVKLSVTIKETSTDQDASNALVLFCLVLNTLLCL